MNQIATHGVPTIPPSEEPNIVCFSGFHFLLNNSTPEPLTHRLNPDFLNTTGNNAALSPFPEHTYGVEDPERCSRGKLRSNKTVVVRHVTRDNGPTHSVLVKSNYSASSSGLFNADLPCHHGPYDPSPSPSLVIYEFKAPPTGAPVQSSHWSCPDVSSKYFPALGNAITNVFKSISMFVPLTCP